MATTWNAADSAQIIAAETVPPTLNSGCDIGEMQHAYGKLTVAAASGNATARMCRLPGGKIKIFPKLSWVSGPDGASGHLISVGLGAYVNGTGATVNADVDALLTATDFGNGAVRSALLGTVTNSEFSIDVTSQAGVNVTISASGADSGASGLFEVLVAFMPQG